MIQFNWCNRPFICSPSWLQFCGFDSKYSKSLVQLHLWEMIYILNVVLSMTGLGHNTDNGSNNQNFYKNFFNTPTVYKKKNILIIRITKIVTKYRKWQPAFFYTVIFFIFSIIQILLNIFSSAKTFGQCVINHIFKTN